MGTQSHETAQISMSPMSIEAVAENCRLGQLNYDCLERIFEKLCTLELIKLCQINSNVCDAIKNRAIKKRVINFDDWNRIWCTEKVFEEFAECIQTLGIGERNMRRESDEGLSLFEHFLSLIIKYCAKNRLTMLSLHFDIGSISADLLDAVRPFLTNLHQIHIRSVNHRPNPGQEQFLETVIRQATAFETIILENTWINGSWLQLSQMKSVKNLALINSSIGDDAQQNWQSYFNHEPELKHFIWINSSAPNRWLCENVAQHCKKLEHFIDIEHMLSNESLRDNFGMNRYSFLSSVENLKCVKVTALTRSGHDLIEFFNLIARKNTVEFLSIHFLLNAVPVEFNANRRGPFYKYSHFTSIKNLEIHNYSTCMIWNETILNFIYQLVNLREILISGIEPMNSVQVTCIALAPTNLEMLKIHRIDTHDLHNAIRTIGIEMNKRKSANSKAKTLTIVLNAKQNALLKGHDINDNIRILVV